MPDLVDILADRGFEEVDAGLPGGWATDGEWTVVVQSRPTGLGGVDHEVCVYDEPAGLIAIGSEPAARAYSESHNRAIRTALDEAGYDAAQEVADD